MNKYIDLRTNYNKEDLIDAANTIKNGGLVLFPTETVYGIGANGLDDNAVNKIFLSKGRKQDNPLILHISNFDMINDIAKEVNSLEKTLIDAFFPGPLTIILKKKEGIAMSASAGLDTVGIRMPSNIIAHDLIELSDVPIAAPSANISGKPSGTNIEDIYDELADKMDYIINGGNTNIGVESTVIRVINNQIHILRPGKITKEDLQIYADVIVDNHILKKLEENETVLSPGMKYKHYAPSTNCLLVYNDNKEKLINILKEYDSNNNIIITNENNLKYFNNAISYGKTLDDITHNIFSILRNADKQNKELIVIEGVKTEGLGLAIMNRLIRACAYNIREK